MQLVKIIAELGSNPAAYDWEFAPFCDAALMAGADAVKVQLWRTEHFPQPEWREKRPLEFPRGRLPGFVDAAHLRGLDAGASVFDLGAVLLAARHCDWLKLAAREQDNHELGNAVEATGKPFHRSVSRWQSLHNFWLNPRGITLFTVQQYPVSMLAALASLITSAARSARAGISWGWSSHTRGWLDSVLAAALGACVIEKHLALSPSDVEAGHSLLPAQFKEMVQRVRDLQ